MSAQEGDVALLNDTSRPEAFLDQVVVEFTIEVLNGLMTMTPDFDTAVKLSLFGGAKTDSGATGSRETWWGNLTEQSAESKYVSRTQFVLNTTAATSGNLPIIEDAVRQDLAWFLTTGTASSVDITVSIPSPSKVRIEGTIRADGLESSFSFTENWKASS